jgi:hypothetical protein
MPTNPAAPSPNPGPAPSGLLGRYLTHPGATTSHLLHEIGHRLAVLGTHLGPPLVGALVLAVVAVVVFRRRATAAMASEARQVAVLAPPEVGPDGRPCCGPTWSPSCARRGGAPRPASPTSASRSPPGPTGSPSACGCPPACRRDSSSGRSRRPGPGRRRPPLPPWRRFPPGRRRRGASCASPPATTTP